MAITKIQSNAFPTSLDLTNISIDLPDGTVVTADVADGIVSSQKLSDNIEFSGSYVKVPTGTTAQRPESPTAGYLRYNTTLDQLEQYTADAGWQGISPPPVVTSTDVNNIDEADATQVIVITGQNFDTNAIASLVDANGVTKTPTTSVRNSSSQITITYSGGDVLTSAVSEPLDVRVVNGSGLSAVLEDAINIDAKPIWTTASGSLGTVYEDVAMSSIQLQATDPEGSSVNYSITSGALPTGTSISSGGLISGTPNVNDTYNPSGVVHNFTVAADDTTGNTTARSFSIIRKWYDGGTSATAASSAQAIADLGITSGDAYYINFGGALGTRQVRCEFLNSEGFYVVANMSMGWRQDLKWSANDITGWRGTDTNYGSVTNAYNATSPQYRDGDMWYNYSGTKVGVMVHSNGTQFGSGSFALFNLNSTHTNSTYYDLFRNYGNGGGVSVTDSWYAQAGMSTGGSPNATTGHHSSLDYCCLSRALGPNGTMRVQHSMNNNGARLLFSYQYLETSNEDRTRGIACNYAKTSGDPDGTDADWNTPGSPVWMSSGGNFSEDYRSYRPTIPNSSAVYPDNSDASSRSWYSPYNGSPYEYALLIK